MSTLACFHAAAVLPHADAWVRDGVVVVDRGRVLEVLSAAEARACHAGAAWHELGDVVLTAGLVNAHAHLELGALHGRCPAGAGMLPWIGGVLRERASLVAGDFARGVAEGARRLLATGTTTVGDIDSSGASAAELGASGLRGRVYREVLDARDASRLADARARLELRVAAGPRGRACSPASRRTGRTP
ncbi:MAG: hypothetical protein H6828_04360 [Planctomycetes bacterium]|nr:hypothetical protein [Planctomycetota bacterium]